MDRVEAGDLKPLRRTCYPMSEAPAAMRLMQQARHMGKIVLTTPPLAGRALRHDRTYLITGGLAGIGLESGSIAGRAWCSAPGTERPPHGKPRRPRR